MNKNIENELWGKTIISVYRFLPAIADAVDNIIKKKTINSLFYSSTQSTSTYELANKVIELTERKIKIINLKVVFEKAINKLKGSEQKLLMLFYVDGVKYQDIMKIFKISVRTFFRRKEIALKNLAKEFIALGYDSDKLKSYLKSEHWIINTYNQFASSFIGRYNIDSNVINYKLLKMAINEINNPFNVNYKFSS